jgi:NADH-quinone oxidoreductase subunit E
VNGLTLLALIAIAVAVALAYRLGALHARGQRAPSPPLALPRDSTTEAAPSSAPSPALPPDASLAPPVAPLRPSTLEPADATIAERARLVRSYEADSERLRRTLASREAEVAHLRGLAGERVLLFAALADARAETARYRQIVVDLENDAPPPLLESPTAPDDLKLIVGIGPVLERMLQQMGIATYRQIARWSERDVDEFDARLHEFPGRIRRDAWVTQARELHQSKYGESAVSKERS